jgi:hypothetical protein
MNIYLILTSYHRGGVFVWGNWVEVWGVFGVGNLGCRGQSSFEN